MPFDAGGSDVVPFDSGGSDVVPLDAGELDDVPFVVAVPFEYGDVLFE